MEPRMQAEFPAAKSIRVFGPGGIDASQIETSDCTHHADFFLHELMTQSALAITAEVAKKCGDLTDKAYPLRVPGNPAAGHLNGTQKDVENYFNKCVTNGGKVPDRQAPKETK
jgi:hypothetical protein